MTKMIEITETEFNTLKALTLSVHAYLDGDLTCCHFYGMGNKDQPVWSKYNRMTKEKKFYKTAE